MSLYLTHRPIDFSEVVGNKEILSALEGVLAKKEKPHSYLLTGETGCGKTTVARIIAKKLGCKGSDYKEVDSADFRGIDTIREIRKQIQYKPLEGTCVVWLIDECHKLTNDAQNALLKTLEDTPNHVYFILATTDPQKLLNTIKGRCSQFQLKVLTDMEMYRLLKKVVLAEKSSLDKNIYEQIILDSMGHPRNALQILEQVLAVTPDKRLDVAKRKAEEYNEMIELCRVLINTRTSWKEVAKILTGLKEQEPETIRRVVLGYAQSVLLKGVINDRAGLILEEFGTPFYDSGFPKLTYACYSVCRQE